MGNIPAKLTGKYQSYDINTPAQVTPPITVRKSNGNFVYQDHENVRKSFGNRNNNNTTSNYDTFNFNNSNFQPNSFDRSYQYAFQRQQQSDVSRRLEMHNSNSVDDEDEDERHNGSYGREDRNYDGHSGGARERLVERTNVSDSVNSNTSERRLNGVRLEHVEDDSSDVEHQDHQREEDDEDLVQHHQHHRQRDHFKYDVDVDHENESGIDSSKRTDRDEDSTSKDHEDDFSNHSISVSIINEKGIDILPSDYCQHGEFLEDHLEDECERERERLGQRGARAIDVMY